MPSKNFIFAHDLVSFSRSPLRDLHLFDGKYGVFMRRYSAIRVPWRLYRRNKLSIS